MNETELEKDKKYLQIRYDRKHGRSSKLFEKAHL